MKKSAHSDVDNEPKRSPLAFVVLFLLFALLAWIYVPVTRGDFVADDYVFIVTARMVDTPLAAFWQSHFYEPYYFRPVGVVSWWLVTRLFGLDYNAHSLINLFLHCANAGLLFWLLRALALRASAVVAGTVLFALGPFALATILWPSNRFDLLAIGFLLLQAIAMLRALQGNVLALPLAMLAALAACWSKELAYPVATALACIGLAASGVPWRRRVLLFALLGGAIGGAFGVRHITVTGAYALANADPIAQIVDGATAMVSLLPRLTELIIGAERSLWFGWGLLGAVIAALIWPRRDGASFNRLIGGTTLVWVAAFVVQTPLAKNFAVMLDGGAFGTITFARFYYAPWLVACVLTAIIVARGRLGGFAALIIFVVTVAGAMASTTLSESFATWTRGEIKPVAVAATQIVEQGAITSANAAPCVYVFLGTQATHPYFRMFADVTAKARATTPGKTWRCYVMTESTPWLFAFPAAITPIDLPLRAITNPDGTEKSDAVWSSIRYRYRLPAKDLAALPGARFFEWRDGAFVEISDDVRRGERKITSQDW
jgi:hypothetical protein